VLGWGGFKGVGCLVGRVRGGGERRNIVDGWLMGCFCWEEGGGKRRKGEGRREMVKW
jgi:hypothetical protein